MDYLTVHQFFYSQRFSFVSVFSSLVFPLFLFLVNFQFQVPITSTTGFFLGKSDSSSSFSFQFHFPIFSFYALNYAGRCLPVFECNLCIISYLIFLCDTVISSIVRHVRLTCVY